VERDCPTPIEEHSRFTNATTIAQARNEQPSDFAHRALLQIAARDRAGERFDDAILFVGNAEKPGTNAARRLIALGIAAAAEATGTFSELLVVAPADADAKLRDQLLELTNDLVIGAERRALPVRVRFEHSGSADAVTERPLSS
jgi:hypothetical protein